MYEKTRRVEDMKRHTDSQSPSTTKTKYAIHFAAVAMLCMLRWHSGQVGVLLEAYEEIYIK